MKGLIAITPSRSDMKSPPMKHLLPPLPYAPSALEPHIDTRTMVLHHDLHHAAYVKALNVALESAPVLLQDKPADWLLMNPGSIPPDLQAAVRNNAGGHVNHCLLWRAMSPDGGGIPSAPLADALDHSFGSFEKFKSCFEEAGSKLFGSGWVWLVKAAIGDGLQVLTTSGHGNPLSEACFPLLVNDVWEHAYYLKHENRRADYLRRWWPVVDWNEASRRFERPAAS